MISNEWGLPLTFTGLESIRNNSKSGETCVYRLCDNVAKEKGRDGMTDAIAFIIELKENEEIYISFNCAKDRSGLNDCTFQAEMQMCSLPVPD